jgi:hypothetical protein
MIRDDVYNKLAKIKGNKSFSDIIEELILSIFRNLSFIKMKLSIKKGFSISFKVYRRINRRIY